MTNDSRTGAFWERHDKLMQDPEHEARFDTELARIRAVDAEANADDTLDDLTRRARAAARDGEYDTSALLSELADEVDRLRAELERTEQQIHEDGGFIDRIVDLEGDVSAARAALERVKDRDALAALIASVDGLAVDAGGKVDGFHYDAADAILNALEGES